MEDRFQFGKNWLGYSRTISAVQIERAKQSLKEMLAVENLNGLNFLDVGCGSGLFSLAARELGANVFSFDYDPNSVKCTELLREKYKKGDADWKVTQGSVLEKEFLGKLGTFDIVYSWGVLHHTGAMYPAFENVAPLVKAGGKLFIAIYNDQGLLSKYWTWVKKTYVRGGKITRGLLLGFFGLLGEGVRFLKALLQGKLYWPPREWRRYHEERGMSVWFDLIDWVGGYPFEVARPEEVFRFFHSRGFKLTALKTRMGQSGCNEYVFERGR